MDVTLSLDKIEEVALCIVHNQLNEDEACTYAKEMAIECNNESVIDADVVLMQEGK